LALCFTTRAQESQPSPRQVLLDAITRWADLFEGKSHADTTLVGHFKVTRSQGLPDEAKDAVVDLAYQAPDRSRVSLVAANFPVSVARDRNTIWVDEPAKKFAVLGKPGVPLFKAEPNRLDTTRIPPFTLPLSRLKLALIPYVLDVDQLPSQQIDDADCDVLSIRILPQAADLLKLSHGQVKLYLRHEDRLPLRITFVDENVDIQIDATKLIYEDPWTDEQWQLHAAPGTDVQTTAVSHLIKFLHVVPKLQDRVAPLGPPDGSRSLVAEEGKGRLEMIDGTRVLFLKGSPAEMGHQQGILLNKQVHDICDRILYGVGVGSSFERGKWFISEIEDAQARLLPFMDKKYLAEMDALADATEMDRQEARLANFFPELFHCTGFSLFGKAVADGHMYHGRVLDYLRGVGLEQNAVVVIYQPDHANAWVNLGYAGFVGSVTAMNEKGISIGEMGGDGYGDWDGKPMAHLVREVMEKSNSLDDAIRIMRDSPRTCHYYYVISDGKTKQAVDIEATPKMFRVVHPGESVPQLPHAFEDAVLLSAGDRYETLCDRVRFDYGNFDALSARKLMSRPVCMPSNIQSVLFRPDTLDFWVANADSRSVASAARFTHYHLKHLLTTPRPRTALEKMKDTLGIN
jgi:hypothetical protein